MTTPFKKIMTRFTRSELLALYNKDYVVPDGVQKIKGIFIQESQQPQLSQNELLNVHGKQVIRVPDTDKPNKKQPKPEIKAQTTWYYLDPSNKIQGPFTSEQLRAWWEKGLFPPNLKISQSKDMESFREATNVFCTKELVFTFNPALFPFILDSLPTNPDPLQKIVIDFDTE